MDQNTFILLIQRIDSVKEDVDEVKADVKIGFEEVKADIKALLSFKWQLMGGTVVASTIMSILIAFCVHILAK